MDTEQQTLEVLVKYDEKTDLVYHRAEGTEGLTTLAS
jgi:hypothetical protein